MNQPAKSAVIAYAPDGSRTAVTYGESAGRPLLRAAVRVDGDARGGMLVG